METYNDLTSRKQNRSDNISIINLDDNVITEASEITDSINYHFTNVGGNLANNISKSNVNPTQYIKTPNSAFSFQEIHIDKVRQLPKQINVKKSTGLDNLPGKLLKTAPDILAPSLTKLFNKSLSTGVYLVTGNWPELLLYLKVVINHADMHNYRPISIISGDAKVFGKIICDQRYSKNRAKQKGILMYKVNNNCAPQYLQQLFTPNVSRYDLKNSLNKLSVPKPRTDYLKCSFSYRCASLWNSLPKQLRSASSLKSFKVALNNFL